MENLAKADRKKNGKKNEYIRKRKRIFWFRTIMSMKMNDDDDRLTTIQVE